MRKLGICVLLAGAVASFPAVHAQDAQDVVADAPPTDEIAPTDETIGAVDDGTVFTTQIEEAGEVLPPELVDPQPGDDGAVVDDGGEIVDDRGEVIDDGGEIVDDGGEVIDDGGEIVDDGGEVIDDGGEIVDDGGEVIDDGGEIVDDGGEVIDDGGEIVDDGGEVIDDGGEIVDDGGEVIDDGGEIVDDGGEVIDDGGEIVDDGGEVIDDGGEIVDDGGEVIDGGEIKVGEVVGDGTVGEVIYYTMSPGDGVNPEVVREDVAAGGDPAPVEGQLPVNDELMYATGAPESDTAAPLESRDASSDAALPAEVDDAARDNQALPAAFPAPMDVMDSERPKH